jgi:hypothetical protein
MYSMPLCAFARVMTPETNRQNNTSPKASQFRRLTVTSPSICDHSCGLRLWRNPQGQTQTDRQHKLQPLAVELNAEYQNRESVSKDLQQSWKATTSLAMSVRPSAFIRTTVTGKIVVKLYTRGFKIILISFKIGHKNNIHFTEDLLTFKHVVVDFHNSLFSVRYELMLKKELTVETQQSTMVDWNVCSLIYLHLHDISIKIDNKPPW